MNEVLQRNNIATENGFFIDLNQVYDDILFLGPSIWSSIELPKKYVIIP